MTAHNSEPYYRPHEDTRLAFEARGIYHLSRAPERNPATDLNERLIFRVDARTKLAERFPEATDEMLDHMTDQAVEIEIAEHEIARHRRDWKRLDRGDVSLEPPQPKRPETLLIAARFQQMRGQNPQAADWDLWNQVAEFFNDGHPATGRLSALDAWGVRSAVTAYGGLEVKSDLTGGYLAKRKRRERLEEIHPWDKNIYDLMYDADVLRKTTPRFADFRITNIAAVLFCQKVLRPLSVFDALYRMASTDRRLKGFRGRKLADRIEAVFGFEATVDRTLTMQDFRSLGLRDSDFISNALI
jgi:hypothetical protein